MSLFVALKRAFWFLLLPRSHGVCVECASRSLSWFARSTCIMRVSQVHTYMCVYVCRHNTMTLTQLTRTTVNKTHEQKHWV